MPAASPLAQPSPLHAPSRRRRGAQPLTLLSPPPMRRQRWPFPLRPSVSPQRWQRRRLLPVPDLSCLRPANPPPPHPRACMRRSAASAALSVADGPRAVRSSPRQPPSPPCGRPPLRIPPRTVRAPPRGRPPARIPHAWCVRPPPYKSSSPKLCRSSRTNHWITGSQDLPAPSYRGPQVHNS
ncbi:hypothetical protein PVAP13_9KG540800 [Panicum virgatum]|uniref:Uncharacterized protein n=1 Tax=Panicum virgatum TaxID=38727 RepID=A0A8T0P0A7_PANVG|nr:hypothetical protein PVAP13_9KG540800 [Panicum virgatum]